MTQSQSRIRDFFQDNFALSKARRTTTTEIEGLPETGKTKLIESMFMQDALAGRGCGLIDPTGKLFRHCLARLALHPEVWHRVVIFDPCDPDWTLPINPLEVTHGVTHAHLSQFMTDIVVKLWQVDAAQAPRMHWLMANTFLALAYAGLSLVDLRDFLTLDGFRAEALARISSFEVRSYFMHDFSSAGESVKALLSRLGTLIFDNDVKPAFVTQPKIRFRDIMDNNMIFLAHQPKGIIGAGASGLLGAFEVAMFHRAGLSRADSDYRPLFSLFLDEFHQYTTDLLCDVMAELRQFGLALTVAHQHLDQLTPAIKSAILNIVGTRICFRVGWSDAKELAHYIFPSSDFLRRERHHATINHVGSFPFVNVETNTEGIGWERLAQMLANQPNREYWLKQSGVRNPVRLRTHDLPDPVITDEWGYRIAALRKMSGDRFGMPKRVVQRQMWATQRERYEKYGQPPSAPAPAQPTPRSTSSATGSVPTMT